MCVQSHKGHVLKAQLGTMPPELYHATLPLITVSFQVIIIILASHYESHSPRFIPSKNTDLYI